MPLVCPSCVLFVVKSSRFVRPNTRNGVLQSWFVTVVRRGDFGQPSGASLSAGNSSSSTPDMFVRHPITAERRYLENNSAANWQPVQFTKEITGVVVADADVEDGACELVMRALQLLEVFIGSNIQQGITVIHPGADAAAGNHVGYVTCEVTSNVTQCTDVKVARAHNAVRMGLEGQLIVEGDAEGFQLFAHIDAASGYTDGSRLCHVTQFLRVLTYAEVGCRDRPCRTPH